MWVRLPFIHNSPSVEATAPYESRKGTTVVGLVDWMSIVNRQSSIVNRQVLCHLPVSKPLSMARSARRPGKCSSPPRTRRSAAHTPRSQPSACCGQARAEALPPEAWCQQVVALSLLSARVEGGFWRRRNVSTVDPSARVVTVEVEAKASIRDGEKFGAVVNRLICPAQQAILF
jgi:hypothetical protein